MNVLSPNRFRFAIDRLRTTRIVQVMQRVHSATMAHLTGSWLTLGVMAGTGALLWYGAMFILPRSVAFSFSERTCVSELTLLPSMQRATGGETFEVTHESNLALGPMKLASMQTCFTPKELPEKGVSSVAVAPFGGPVLGARYAINVAQTPSVSATVQDIQLAASKPLKISLDQPDEISTYYVTIDQGSQRCSTLSSEVLCRVNELGVEQGNTYPATVIRTYAKSRYDTVAKLDVSVLPAVQITDSTIKPNETVYAKPTELRLMVDKPLTEAAAQLHIEGDTAQIPVQTRVEGNAIIVTLREQLPREKTFNLVVTTADASDGSGLDGPYTLRFGTSGGPKVAGVNIGHVGVSQGAKVVVTFDQPLAPGQPIGSVATISGGTARVSYSGKQVIFALQSVPFCSAFQLRVGAGLVGELNGIAGTQSWSYDARTSCRAATRTIGHSVKGRPIVAYYYGAGSSSVLFTGGIHGNEKSGVYILDDWVEYLDKYAYKLPAGRQIVIVPKLSPDGFAANDRYNAHGVNLARNFPSADWATDIGVVGGVKPGGGGTAPLSEPEAQAIAALTETLRPRLMVSYHSKGSLVGINKVGDSASLGSAYARAVGYQTMFDNAEQIMGYSFTGEYETWMGEKLGTPAVLIELPSHNGSYFAQHKSIMWDMATR